MKRLHLIACFALMSLNINAVSYTTLQTAITSAENYLASLDLSLYPHSALLEYQDAINVAKAVVAGETCTTTTQVTAYRTALTNAKSKFAATKNKTFDISDVVSGYDYQNRGFVHPGGLHTQVDFDRVKQLLADGDETVTAAYNVLKTAQYAQASCGSSPTETIVRGGSGENYINAARGATIAYQNALRWRIEDNENCAKNAVKVLMAWCNTTKRVTGDSNACLAFGLYGYEFAQAAELMRDYEGWSREDFTKFQRWMLDVWYPGIQGFLRGRNGTWQNSGKWWQAPGHYWSNWGLCNALAAISIGVLCDDVFIYNQGMSFIKYDQVGTFTDPRTSDPILNDGLTEFWGNLVVTTYEWAGETGAYGKVGQMNESGRDTGHAALALGLAVDIAHQGWNQGDDLFSYMDHRLAAGIEYIAAQCQSVDSLPWTNYHYGSSGYYYTDSRAWLMTAPALGAQIRNYWGTVIGHYEGVKGVKMPYSEWCYQQMGIDAGGQGSVSGGYDHLGYSVLLNYRPAMATAEEAPTELGYQMTYNGKTVEHNELGGLTNTYETTAIANRGLAAGTMVTLSPQLPDGESDTGNWEWESGETTREITVVADASHIYRVTYTNTNGVKSQLCFSIAVQGDCQETTMTPTITYAGESFTGTEVTVMWGSSVTLALSDLPGFNNFAWDNGQTTSSITIPKVTTSRDITGYVQTMGGRKQPVTFHIEVMKVRPDIIVNGTTQENTTTCIANAGDTIVLDPYMPTELSTGVYAWSDGSSAETLTLDSITTTQQIELTYTLGEESFPITYTVYVRDNDRVVEVGNYRIRHRKTDTYLTNNGYTVSFEAWDGDLDQIWNIYHTSTLAKYKFMSLSDSLYMKNTGAMSTTRSATPHRIYCTAGEDNYVALSNATPEYWYLDEEGQLILGELTTLEDYAFQLIPVTDEELTPVTSPTVASRNEEYYSVSGMRLNGKQRGITIVRMADGSTRKVLTR